jgi:hypothetical protein
VRKIPNLKNFLVAGGEIQIYNNLSKKMAQKMQETLKR